MADTTAAPPKKLVLVDAYSLLFRAFFAGRYLSTTDNRPTGALFGFTNMLFSILNSGKPDAIVVCWDAPQKTLRSQEFEAYKAHRPEVDSQLIAQMPGAREIVSAFGIPSAEVGGYEADDLIGTLACKGVREGYSVVILTGDSDQLQLVGDGVTVQMTQRGVSELKEYDAAAVRERYGVGPEQIADWKALVGDTSDNIPGVPGIGEKTATALLQQWGTLENLLAHVDEVQPPKARAALEANLEQARSSKKLATIVCDVPASFEIRPYKPTEEDWARLREKFLDLEFKSLLPRIPRLQDGMAPLAVKESLAPEQTFVSATVWIGSPEELEDAIQSARRSGTVAIRLDTDASAPMRANLRGIAFAPAPEVGYYVALGTAAAEEEGRLGGLFDAALTPDPSPTLRERGESNVPASPLTHSGEEAKTQNSPLSRSVGEGGRGGEGHYRASLDALRPLLEDPAIAKVAHNAKFAEIVLERQGVKPTPLRFDTLIAAYLLNSGLSSYPLMDLAETHLGVRLDTEDAFAPEETLARETALIFSLVEPLRERLAELGMTEIMERVEMPLVPVLAEIEETGLLVDKPYLETLSARIAERMEALAKEVYELAGEEFNIGSTKQLQTILFDKLQLPTGKKIK